MNYLEIRAKNTNYAYATGRIRGLEKYLLTDADLARLEEAPSLQTCYDALARYHPYTQPFRSYDDSLAYGQALEDEWARTYEELHQFVPEPALLNLFWFEHDMHNLKVICKLQANGILPDNVDDIELLSRAGTIALEALHAAITKGETHSLSGQIRELIDAVHAMLERETSARRLEIFIDRHFWQAFIQGLHGYDDPFLDELARRLIDEENLRIALRIKLWERKDEAEILREAIIPQGLVAPLLVREQAAESLDTLADSLRGTPYFRLVQSATDEWQASKTLFFLEESFWKAMREFIKSGTYITFGREPLIQYVLQKKKEITQLRHMLRSKQAGTAPHASEG